MPGEAVVQLPLTAQGYADRAWLEQKLGDRFRSPRLTEDGDWEVELVRINGRGRDAEPEDLVIDREELFKLEEDLLRAVEVSAAVHTACEARGIADGDAMKLADHQLQTALRAWKEARLTWLYMRTEDKREPIHNLNLSQLKLDEERHRKTCNGELQRVDGVRTFWQCKRCGGWFFPPEDKP
jgi:rubrerythrin